MLCVEEIKRRIYGIKLGHTTLVLTNLLYADDMLVFCRGNEDNKSSIFFSLNTEMINCCNIKKILGDEIRSGLLKEHVNFLEEEIQII